VIYTYTSTNKVLARVQRRTRMTDTTYHDDMIEAINEAVKAFRMRNALTPTTCVLEVRDHTAKLPCGMQLMDGLYYCGARLRKSPGVVIRHSCDYDYLEKNTDTYFTDTLSEGYTKNEQDYKLLRGDDLKMSSDYHSSAYYIPYPNYIQTSFREGKVILFYRRFPVDKDNYPLIPDEASAKDYIFWYLMAELTLSGYKHVDPKHDYDYCTARAELYLRKAKSALRTMSMDTLESLHNTTDNLVPRQDYYDNFFIGAEQPKFVRK
jgi:hypothetical protein